ncbi:MAG: hypothetical protein LZF86_110727 [Nitrospira sp.]|nr:MAG: hypothetical protein LZF86_110727 [Nitrospira sp.]
MNGSIYRVWPLPQYGVRRGSNLRLLPAHLRNGATLSLGINLRLLYAKVLQRQQVATGYCVQYGVSTVGSEA